MAVTKQHWTGVSDDTSTDILEEITVAQLRVACRKFHRLTAVQAISRSSIMSAVNAMSLNTQEHIRNEARRIFESQLECETPPAKKVRRQVHTGMEEQ